MKLFCKYPIHGNNFNLKSFSSLVLPKPTLRSKLFSSNSLKPLYQVQPLQKVKKMTQFIHPITTPIFLLDCEDAFSSLSEKEKLYAHYLSRACWYGSLIVLPQTSLESPLIFNLLHKLFSLQSVQELNDIALKECSLTEDEFSAFLFYTCGIMFHLGNYKSQGHKFIPDLPKEKLTKLLLASAINKENPKAVESLLSRCLEKMYSLEEDEIQLSFPPIGTTTYFSKNMNEIDHEIVKKFYEKHNLEAYNTRVFKVVEESGKINYEIRLASVLKTEDEEDKSLLFTEDSDKHKFSVTRGDYSEFLKFTIKDLEKAKEFVSNDLEEQMITNYIHSFYSGSLNAHKIGSSLWVKNRGPIVETYIGFIETYKDPAGMRGEFEGFVSVVNKQQSKKFSLLVNQAEIFLPMLPWPRTYEKDKFSQPDFTSLDLLTYAACDVPIGINIPNYIDIKQNVGFKNVSLGNVISMVVKEPPNYLSKDDQDVFLKYVNDALELQVGLHELLGHGSGKLFFKESDGSFNFDNNSVLHLETNQKVTSWYNCGETYDSVFGGLGSPYEECKAECVGLYLCTVPDILKIFVPENDSSEDVMYVNWIMVVLAGLAALDIYEPKTETWLQAHNQAAFVILKVLLENGDDFIKIEKVTGLDGKPDLLFTLDRSRILSTGKSCIGNFLRKLQLYKSTADVVSGKAMFDKYSAVTSEDRYPFLEYREIVLARKKPRRMIVQSNTVLKDGKVKLVKYEASPEGMIQSFVDRFKTNDISAVLENIWAEDQPHFC